MISVDIYVPSVDATYDFQLDENAAIKKIILEIAGMISRKVKWEGPIHSELFSLYEFEQGDELFREETLSSYGIQDGDRLMLV